MGLGQGRRSKHQKNPGIWADDPTKLWRSYKDRSNNQFHDICSFFGVEKWEPTEAGKLVKINLPMHSVSKDLSILSFVQLAPVASHMPGIAKQRMQLVLVMI
jgi:hypothetical protein